ncbi:Tat pathway signal sequence domain protein [Caulobacter segnis]|uniref:Tat pathway signal sequence domain protein n=1 Tax=Caulobacter segnis TaxID=88688 RepID=A0ABM6TMI5_9CAUL|nr:Tat pathway signal sequence domain protein [Caulobacter segnis]
MLDRRSLLASLAATPFADQAPYRREQRLFADDFRRGLDQWVIEAEKPATAQARDGVLEIIAPGGLTAWFKPELIGPAAITYQAQAVSAGGPYDRVSDLNAFWMAREVDGGSPLDHPRSGAFADYDTLKTYYVGHGGNSNTTTRFRRYVGRPGERPLLPQHDHAAPEEMLTPNRWVSVRLVADGRRIEYWSDGRRLFDLDDPAPYPRGWFGLRTTQSHLRIRDFAVFRLAL